MPSPAFTGFTKQQTDKKKYMYIYVYVYVTTIASKINKYYQKPS